VMFPRLLQVRIDHRHGTLHFGAQQLESDRVRSHLQLLAQRLSKVSCQRSSWSLHASGEGTQQGKS
jgi:translation initiation factor 3 subunit A